jgi:hypothetical protein
MCKRLANMTQVNDVAPGPLVQESIVIQNFHIQSHIFIFSSQMQLKIKQIKLADVDNKLKMG